MTDVLQATEVEHGLTYHQTHQTDFYGTNDPAASVKAAESDNRIAHTIAVNTCRT